MKNIDKITIAVLMLGCGLIISFVSYTLQKSYEMYGYFSPHILFFLILGIILFFFGLCLTIKGIIEKEYRSEEHEENKAYN